MALIEAPSQSVPHKVATALQRVSA
jgi:hypothetical protein